MNDTNAQHAVDPYTVAAALGIDDLRDVASAVRALARERLTTAARFAGERWGTNPHDQISEAQCLIAAAERFEAAWDAENPLEEEDE